MDRKKIVHQVHRGINELFARKEEFVPGQTPVLTGKAIYDGREICAIFDSLMTGWWAVSHKATEFEEGIAKYVGSKCAVFVNSGSSASLLALNAIKNQRKLKGGEVITPAVTFPTTLNPIIQLGFTPCFVDIDDTLNLNPELVLAAINKKTVGIVVPHTLGNPCRIDIFQDAAKNKGLFLIEDSCDAIGSSFNGRKCGSFGDASTFSFYPAHNITTGEGGAISTNDQGLERIIRSLRDWGKDCWCQSHEKNPDGVCGRRFDFVIDGIPYDHRYIYSQIGFNLKPLEIQAAMGVEQLKRLEEFNSARKRNFKRFKEELAPLREHLEIPRIYSGADPVLFGLPLILKTGERSELLKYLNKHKIATRLLFAGNALHQPAYEGIDYAQPGSLEKTDLAARKCFWIGIHPDITKEAIKYVALKLKEYFTK